LWISFVYILFVRVAGKFGGSALVARVLGNSWKDSLSIGAPDEYQGTHGVGCAKHWLLDGLNSKHGDFFTYGFMALLTTMMTSPLLNWINSICKAERIRQTSQKHAPNKFYPAPLYFSAPVHI
jgi:hypothetical protein